MAKQPAEGAPANSPKRPRISFFDQDELEETLLHYINPVTRPQPNLQDDFSMSRYRMRDAFSTTDGYWIRKVQGDRFDKTFESGILYRPDTVNEMMKLMNECWNHEEIARGIMIKGPHGVGKSHSIVNLVRKLLYNSNGKFLVTFIPDCKVWEDIENLYDAICSSFGCTMVDIGFDDTGTGPKEERKRFGKFIAAIDLILAKNGMKWIFVFDQINSLFTRTVLKEAKDVSSLPFPFSTIHRVMKLGRITSIISASANNDSSYRQSHSGFIEYNHPCSMTRDEINSVFQELTNLSVEHRNEIYEVTGCIPLQVAELISLDFSVEMYQMKVVDLIQSSLRVLQRENALTPTVFQDVTKSALACLLFSGEIAIDYDRKYSIQSIHGGLKYYSPLFPMVLVAYRIFFWDLLLSSLKAKEKHMLSVCKDQQVTQDVRGRLFELIVINRCKASATIRVRSPAIARGFPKLRNCILFKEFPSQNLPNPDNMEEIGIYVPLNSNFPAIDMIWKYKRRVCGVQIHTATHNNTEQMFEQLCTAAGWFEAFTHVHMLYLSPTADIASEMQTQVHQLQRVHVAAASILNVSCLANLPW